MPPQAPVARVAASRLRPHAHVWNAPTDPNHPLLRLPTVNFLIHTHPSYPSISGAPGYNRPAFDYSTFQREPHQPWPESGRRSLAKYMAQQIADHLHFQGRVEGTGEYENGSSSGATLGLRCGYCEAAEPTFTPLCLNAHPGDAVSDTQPYRQLRKNYFYADPYTKRWTIDAGRMTFYKAAGIAEYQDFVNWVMDDLGPLLDSYTPPASIGGPTVRLLRPRKLMLSNEHPLWPSLVHAYGFFSSPGTLESIVTNPQTEVAQWNSQFYDYLPGPPQQTVLGYVVPGSVQLYHIANQIAAIRPDGTATDRFFNEPIYYEKVNGVLVPRTFNYFWQQAVAAGDFPNPSHIGGQVNVNALAKFNNYTGGTVADWRVLLRLYWLCHANFYYWLRRSEAEPFNARGWNLLIGEYARSGGNSLIRSRSFVQAATRLSQGYPDTNSAEAQYAKTAFTLDMQQPTLYWTDFNGQAAPTNFEKGLSLLLQQIYDCDETIPIVPWLSVPTPNGSANFGYGNEDYVFEQLMMLHRLGIYEYAFWSAPNYSHDAFYRTWTKFQAAVGNETSGYARRRKI